MKKVTLLLLILHYCYTAFSQQADSTQTPLVFSGSITATNNGISLIPNFSLNKPAALFDLSFRKRKISFDPMLRFGMNGKPWSFIFWWRYKVIDKRRFSLGIGAHPSVVFKSTILSNNGVENEYLTAQRYFAWEATPTLVINKKVSAGIYYLGSHGLTKDLTQYTTLLTVRAALSELHITPKLYFTLIPQVYYLKMDQRQGVYTSAVVILGMKKFPVGISSIISKAIDTQIPGKDLLWNIGLVYDFRKAYYKH